jgi:hypothetical protein
LVLVNEQVPAKRAFTTPEVIEQFAEPEVTEYETAPVPDPPETANVMPESRSPELSRKVKVFCVSFANVTSVATDDCDS